MNDKEILKLGAIRDVCEKRIRRADAARVLSLSVRQVQRLVTRFRQHGAEAIVHQRRGQPSSNRINRSVKLRCLVLIREHYTDFGPTLAHEKLTERHDIHVSVETLRQWMIADGLWVPHAKRKPRVYQPRYRRDCLGELVQIDGSHHDWFEGRSPKCCLLVYIDDATGRLMNLRFSETESAFDYMVTTREYIDQH
ncbi:ISNCY family transposase, partial [Photobacterium aquae]|uniref:ISNCY family transposase n=1 Tax=Photobacterium aquae TaxID=1195763 RepID=UPI0014707D19